MNARGQISQFTSGNGLATTQTFDHGFLTGIQTGTIQNLQYSWDKATGNLTWRKDANRNLTENFAYDNLDRLTGITGSTTANYRGYTGHEHLDGFGIINMNGRVYDPITGRFLSPDNIVQSPGFTQSYNRYSYCMNNPLKYTDPSGWEYSEAEDYATWSDWWKTHTVEGPDFSAWMDKVNSSNPWYTPNHTMTPNEQLEAFQRQSVATIAGVKAWLNSTTISVNGVPLGRFTLSPYGTKTGYNDANGNFVEKYNFVEGYDLVSVADAQGPPGDSDPYAKYGKVIGGFNLSATFAFLIAGWNVEMGYVITDKNYKQYYITFYTTESITASANINAFGVVQKGNHAPTLSDWKGGCWEVGGNYEFLTVQKGGDASGNYNTYTGGIGPGVSWPIKGTGSLSSGRTFLIGVPIDLNPSNALNPAGYNYVDFIIHTIPVAH